MAETPELHHIGYAVESIQAYLDEFVVPLLAPIRVGPIIDDPLQAVRVAFVTLKGGVLELVEPAAPNSPVSRIVKKGRGGLYHVCYVVDAMESALEAFSARDCVVFSGPTPAVAFDGRRIAFLCTPSGDLIELVERAHPSTAAAPLS